jgi:uncharacterized phage infection (PIP) family protein YhgE
MLVKTNSQDNNTNQSIKLINPRQVVTRLIIMTVIAGLIIWGIFGLAKLFTTSNKQKNSPSTNQVTATPTVAVPTTAQKVQTWSTQYSSGLNKIGDDFQQVSTAMKSLDYPTITTSCERAATDIDTFQALPAIPDPTIASHLAIALTSLKSATEDCTDGITQQDPALIYRANDEITQGNQKLGVVATNIKSLN